MHNGTEEVLRPKHAGGRPRNPFSQTEQYKQDRKKSRHKIDPETKSRVSNMNRPKNVPEVWDNQNYYFSFHPKGEKALERRKTLEKLRSENRRNKSKTLTKAIEPTIFQSPNANILQEVSCIDHTTGQQFIVNFLTSDKNLSD